jgi:hypothetical protein
VLTLILLLLLIWFALVVFLAAWTLFFQGYIYTEPVSDLTWRAPAAGSALALFVCLWTVLACRAPGQYQTLFNFSNDDSRSYEELTVTQGGKDEVYKKVSGKSGRLEYRRGDRPLPSRPDKITLTEDGQKATFEPDRDAKGNFKPAGDSTLRYHDDRGREMVEGRLGEVNTTRTGRLLLNLLLNFFHLALWFVCLWLLLRFQWAHALGLAVVMWAVMTLFVLPPLLGKAETAATASPPPATQGK